MRKQNMFFNKLNYYSMYLNNVNCASAESINRLENSDKLSLFSGITPLSYGGSYSIDGLNILSDNRKADLNAINKQSTPVSSGNNFLNSDLEKNEISTIDEKIQREKKEEELFKLIDGIMTTFNSFKKREELFNNKGKVDASVDNKKTKSVSSSKLSKKQKSPESSNNLVLKILKNDNIIQKEPTTIIKEEEKVLEIKNDDFKKASPFDQEKESKIVNTKKESKKNSKKNEKEDEIVNSTSNEELNELLKIENMLGNDSIEFNHEIDNKPIFEDVSSFENTTAKPFKNTGIFNIWQTPDDKDIKKKKESTMKNKRKGAEKKSSKGKKSISKKIKNIGFSAIKKDGFNNTKSERNPIIESTSLRRDNIYDILPISILEKPKKVQEIDRILESSKVDKDKKKESNKSKSASNTIKVDKEVKKDLTESKNLSDLLLKPIINTKDGILKDVDSKSLIDKADEIAKHLAIIKKKIEEVNAILVQFKEVKNSPLDNSESSYLSPKSKEILNFKVIEVHDKKKENK